MHASFFRQHNYNTHAYSFVFFNHLPSALVVQEICCHDLFSSINQCQSCTLYPSISIAWLKRHPTRAVFMFIYNDIYGTIKYQYIWWNSYWCVCIWNATFGRCRRIIMMSHVSWYWTVGYKESIKAAHQRNALFVITWTRSFMKGIRVGQWQFVGYLSSIFSCRVALLAH